MGGDKGPELQQNLPGQRTVGLSQVTSPPTLGVKFVSAGLAACIAELATFPLDTAKVRLQIQGEAVKAITNAGTLVATPVTHISGGATVAAATISTTPSAAAADNVRFKYRGLFRTIYVISSEEGVRALYNGMIAGFHRQMCFASVRIGLYDSVKNAYIKFFHGDNPSSDLGVSNVTLRILAGVTTGGSAVVFAQPTDVVKVRMQAQTGQNLRYTGTIHAYKTIATTEGVRGLWKGVLPNITRNAIVNAAELVSYDLIKEAILKRHLLTDNMPCHFVSAFGAGFCTTVVASPVDVVKTRYMNSAKGVYRGAINCAVNMYKEGGPLAFYKGFMPSFVRLGSWNIVMFVSFEQLKRLFMRMRTQHDD